MVHMDHMAHNLAMPRPCRHDTKWLLRPLTDAQRAILLDAGAGDLTRGFNEVIDLYARIRDGIITNESNSQVDLKESQVPG